jgi:hypothetical protein
MRAIAGLAGLAFLSGCGEPPGQVALSAHDAYERLAKGDLKDFIFERQCGILVHVKTDARPDRSVTWHILSSGRVMLSFTATLAPVNDRRTKVEIAVSREPDGSEAYDGTKSYVRPALKQPLRPAIEELVAALLKGRAFDAKRLQDKNDIHINHICNLQRGGVEAGIARFSINDEPGLDTYGTERRRSGARR